MKAKKKRKKGRETGDVSVVGETTSISLSRSLVRYTPTDRPVYMDLAIDLAQ